MSQRPLSPAVAPVALPAAGSAPRALALGLAAGEWVLLAAALGLWAGSRDYTPAMNVGSALLVGSWLLRWLRLGRLTRPTPLDLPLAVFLISAALAAAVAPDLNVALVRLYLFVGAAALFYALANAGQWALRLFAFAFVFGAAALGLYFASQHDWAAQPAKFAPVGALGRSLSEIVPDLGLYQPHPNVVGAILALAVPVALAFCTHEVSHMAKARRASAAGLLSLAAAGLGGLLVLGGVVLTESRSAWLALAVAAALGAWFWVAGQVSLRAQVPRERLFWGGIAAGLVLAGLLLSLRPGLLTTVFGALPGPNSVVSRLEIFGQVWRLAQDMPFTGGGLDAFPALYSTYVLSIPFLFLTHAHNAYLNVLVEQGWPGLAGYLGLLSMGAWAAVRQVRRGGGWPAGAGALGMAVLLVHGVGEGSLVASRAILALLVPAGLALSSNAAQDGPVARRPLLIVAGLALAALVGAGLIFQRPLLAAWHANWGALAYHRAELADWPTNQWDDGRRAAALAPAEIELQKAVEYQPANRTANHRLGLAAYARRDFAEAAERLRQAYQADTRQRGVIKSLGFTYLWLGDVDAALPLLRRIPEARSELEVYAWWWETQGRPDLGRRAHDMTTRLGP